LGEPAAPILRAEDFTQKMAEAYSSARLANFHMDSFTVKMETASSKELLVNLHQTV
jgi:hypothetical protein